MKLIFLILFPFLCFGQGLIINEISNGTTGTQEYYELVVIGSSSNPLGNVDLGGWIIDDNNGDFEGFTTTGIATGHIRIKPGFYSSVRPGSILVIYNSAELFFTSDPSDSNGDCVYFIPITDPSLENNNSIPSTTNSNYTPATYGALQSWTRIGLRNDGDAVQVRKPGGTFFHGFSYGDVLTPFPNFPSELGGTSSFNIITGTGAGRNHIFNCGNFTTQSNFTRGSAPSNESPGQANNDFNRYFINSVRNGTYNYSNLSDPINCGTSSALVDCSTFLPINITQFDAIKNENKVNIYWSVENPSDVKQFNLEYSNNGYEFNHIGQFYSDNITTEYNFDDDLRDGESYYRLMIEEIDGNITYSNVISVSYKIEDDLIIYPNPTKDILNINKNVSEIEIYDELGMIINQYSVVNNQILVNDLPKGLYLIKLLVDNGVVYRKILIY